MNGLLDFIKTPEGQGLLSGLFGYAANARRGAPVNSIGRGGLAGLMGYSNALERQDQQQENQVQRDYRQMQMGDMQRKIEQQRAQDDWRKNLPGMIQQAQTSYGAGEEGPTMKPGNPDALRSYLMRPESPFADELLKRQLMPKEEEAYTLGEGQVRYRGGQVVAQGPEKRESMPSSVQEYNFAVNQGYKGTFEQWDTARKKAGATNVSVNATKPFINEFAGGLGKAMSDARTNAQGALGTIGTVSRLNDALDSGIMAGPGTSFRQFGLQVGAMLGVAGKDAQEKLLNTRAAIQSLAQLELDAAQQMKGQGQITEAERSIIRRAASGDIDGMTVGELRVLGGVLDRTARSKIDAYNAQVEPLLKTPETAGIAPFLKVNPPEARLEKAPQQKPQGAPMPGQVQDGYRFKGGNPADQKNWEQVR